MDFFRQAEQDAGDRVCGEALAHLGWGEEALGRDGVKPGAMKARGSAVDAFARFCATGWIKPKDTGPIEDQGLIEF